ncbi:unnamed protein product [Rhizoctonia solani]|uniref:Ribosomal RNA methyltransferase FtsJ domain-containing protein n=1 Tax=Rhizoctonia solani TaxID=456999 RepID=A0A8H3DTK4_9AGAM|nr:unnamed protein product [Rhizoctonia solani]
MAAVLDTISWRSELLCCALVARPECNILADLIVLRKQGDESKTIDTYFENERERVHNSKLVSNHLGLDASFMIVLEKAMENMNRAVWIPRTYRFLDIGCAPGGFTSYLLRKNRRAHGIGISLPDEQGGTKFAVTNPDYLARYQLHWVDLTTFDLAPNVPKPPSSTHECLPLPFEPRSRDLVVCDAQWALNPDNHMRPWNWTRLIISQLLIALRAVAPGGSIFIRLSCAERTLTGRIVLALCRVSDLVRSVKPTVFKAFRSHFYILAQKVHPQSDECKWLISALEQLWYTMTFEGESGYGRDISAEDEQLITSDEEMLSEKGLSTIVQLGTPIWEIQHDALCGFLARRGVV